MKKISDQEAWFKLGTSVTIFGKMN